MENQPPLTGQIIDDYLIGPLIGEGAFSVVYQAMPTAGDNNWVAFKILRRQLAEDENLRARFTREITLMQRLDHPHIVPIYDAGDNGEWPYLVMKLVSGRTLNDVQTHERFTPANSLNILRPLSDALGYMHAKGIVHRDIKPENIFLERAPDGYHLYLGDLGLGKQPTIDDPLTRKGKSVGTLEYMAHEALMGQTLDHRADVYSLTVIAYQLLLGRLPIDPNQHAGMPELVLVRAKVTPPQAQNADFPADLAQVLLRGLARHPDERYQTAQDFYHDYQQTVETLSATERETCYHPTQSTHPEPDL